MQSTTTNPVVVQLVAIANKLESIDALQKDVAALKSQSHNRSGNGSGKQDEGDSSCHYQRYRPHNKITFPTFSDGDPRGDANNVAEISYMLFLVKAHLRTMKVQCVATYVRTSHVQVNELKIVQDFFPFQIGGADLQMDTFINGRHQLHSRYVYGRAHASLLPDVMGETKNAELEQQMIDRDDMLKLPCIDLTKVSGCMRNQANSKREELSPRSFGPYRVKRAIGLVAYDLKSPDDAKIHRVFPRLHAQTDHRWVLEAGQPVLELLVSWNQRPLEEANWETYDLLAEQFPNFRLEDKAFYRGGSNDTNLRVYTRKKTRVKAGDQSLPEDPESRVELLLPIPGSASTELSVISANNNKITQ
ncbi:hypothetical protein Tco_0835215 [Tanacetum coccineum]